MKCLFCLSEMQNGECKCEEFVSWVNSGGRMPEPPEPDPRWVDLQNDYEADLRQMEKDAYEF